MDLLLKRSGGHNVVLRPQARPRWYPAATAPAAMVDMWWRNKSEPVGNAQLLGTFPVGQAGSAAYNPDRDENVVFHLVSVSSSGTRSVARLEDAVTAELIYRRETEAPTIGQVGDATAESVTVGITGHTRFARLRRVTVYEDAGDSPGAVITTRLFESDDYAAHELPRYFVLSRFTSSALTSEGGDFLAAEDGELLVTEDEEEALPETVWLTVAHSGGNGWTPESNALEVTFAAGDGSGGSAGEFDPTPVDEFRLSPGGSGE